MLDYKYFAKHIKAGNTKIPVTTGIFNMGSATDCPAKALGLCKNCDICYAMKAERQYPAVLEYRRRQEAIWNMITVEQFVNWFMLWAGRKRQTITALRLNESGDFWTQRCVNKAEEIARALSEWGIVTYLYTARSDLNFRHVDELYVRGSNWESEDIFSTFNTVTKDYKADGSALVCPMDCTWCTMCYSIREPIVVREH